MSAWAKASERSVLKQPSVEDKPLSPEATFQPQLVSNGSLREKAPSSGYGKELPKAKDPSPLPVEDPEATFSPTLSNPSLRLKARSSSYGLEIPKLREEAGPAEDPEATFAPALSNPELREKAQSSQYGRVVAAAPAPPEPEPLEFKPEITMTPLAVALREKAPSQGYGTKILEKPVHEEPEIDRATFHPKLPKDRIRENVASSGYMRNYTPEHKPRPKSARPARTPGSQPATPRSQPVKSPEELAKEEELRRRENGFRLDGVSVAGQLEVQMHYKQYRPQTAPAPQPTPLAQQIKAKARSSGYTKETYTPERGEKPTIKQASEPQLSFRGGSALDSPAPDASSLPVTPSALALKYNDTARSQGYGSDWTPPKGEKREVSALPGFAPTKATAGIPEPAPAPAPRRLKSATNVTSSGYGSGYTPAKGEKKAIELKPGIKAGGSPGIKPLSALPPPPRSALNDRVESHKYGVTSPSASTEPASDTASAAAEPLTF